MAAVRVLTYAERPDFPDDGEYVIPGALVPVTFADGRGVYIEPNVWMRHRL